MADQYVAAVAEYEWRLREAVRRTPEFQKKHLATHSLNVGLICGHQCTYCSTSVMCRAHPAFKALGLNPFERGYCVVDPTIAERLAKQSPKLTERHVVQICTIVDAWAPESRRRGLGRACLQFLLEHTPASVRVLTKNAEIRHEFDLIERYRDRVFVGLSTGIPASRSDVAAAIEPLASPVQERQAVLREASQRNLRTYGMLCPCAPGVSDTREALEELFEAVLSCEAEDIWLEPLNARGRGLVHTTDALRRAGLRDAGEHVSRIRKHPEWSSFAVRLIREAQSVARAKGAIDRLHVLLYPKRLRGGDRELLADDPAGIVWL